MNITAVETIRLREFGNLIWVRIHTDAGLVGMLMLVIRTWRAR